MKTGNAGRSDSPGNPASGSESPGEPYPRPVAKVAAVLAAGPTAPDGEMPPASGSRNWDRRELLRAGFVGAAGQVAGLARGRPAAQATPIVPDGGKRHPQHRVIDTHNHPRWIGHDGARIIQDMDAAGIERTWLLSWEIPEREIDTGYYAKLPPDSVGIPFRDVIDVAERYPDRFIPGTTTDPRDPHALPKLKAAVDIYGCEFSVSSNCACAMTIPMPSGFSNTVVSWVCPWSITWT